ncbi:MAG: cation-translocating P-type ATPase [Planctomycetaceae bacterium]
MPMAPWHTLEASEALVRLETREAGLDAAEAARRLGAHGPNELRAAAPARALPILLAQFRSLIVWILIVAGLVSGMLGEWLDGFAILAIVLLNAAVGFAQEFRAERSLAALRALTAPRARVRRGGRSALVPARELVPGDILELESGDLVSGDARLLTAHVLRCNEASLTGESEPVEKSPAPLTHVAAPLGDRACMVFAGTSVAMGRATAVVAATGMGTEIGRIAQLVVEAAAQTQTPLQHRLHAFGRLLVWASLGVVGLIFLFGILRGIPLFELFLTSVSLAVAAVPEGLPAIVTIALAVGVQRMARQRALVRKLHAVETLGSATVLCTDKTGTLTVGEMTVRALWTADAAYAVEGEGYAPEGRILRDGREPTGEELGRLRELMQVFVGCNSAELALEKGAWQVVGDPTEGALLAAGAKVGVTAATLAERHPPVLQLPFDSDRKRMTVVRKWGEGTWRALVKGAPDLLLARCTHVRASGAGHEVRPLTGADRAAILAANDAMAERALRVLAAACRDTGSAEETDAEAVESNLVFCGLAGMQDPPRAEAAAAVARCRRAGIRPVMITGDHPQTARAIARELGISGPEDRALSGAELDALDEAGLAEAAPAVAAYARVTAAHKLRIVRALQAHGEIVGMTGDGVNDAPALKGADIGIAMGRTGTEVAKESSDMVITDDNFATIVTAVEQGRGIYENIRKTIQYLLAGNTGELLLMTVCVVAGLPLPLLPIQLLWINLVTDGLPALCLSVDPIDRTLMDRPPRAAGERIADRAFLERLFTTGTLTAAVSLLVYVHALRTKDLETARAHAFNALVFAELFKSFGFRSATLPVWRISLLTNLRLLGVVAATAAFQLWSHHSDALSRFLKSPLLPWSDVAVLAALALLPLAGVEILKLVSRPRSPS